MARKKKFDWVVYLGPVKLKKSSKKEEIVSFLEEIGIFPEYPESSDQGALMEIWESRVRSIKDGARFESRLGWVSIKKVRRVYKTLPPLTFKLADVWPKK